MPKSIFPPKKSLKFEPSVIFSEIRVHQNEMTELFQEQLITLREQILSREEDYDEGEDYVEEIRQRIKNLRSRAAQKVKFTIYFCLFSHFFPQNFVL